MSPQGLGLRENVGSTQSPSPHPPWGRAQAQRGRGVNVENLLGILISCPELRSTRLVGHL